MFLTLTILASTFIPLQETQQLETHELRLHDLGGLVRPPKISEAEADAVLTVSGIGGEGSERNSAEGHFPFDSRTQLLHMVKTFMVPKFDESGGNITMQEMEGKRFMITNLSASQDAWLTHFFELQREEETQWMAGINISIYQGDAGEVDFLDGVGRVTILDSAEKVEARKAKLLASGMEDIHRSSMKLLPRQKGKLSVQGETKFVKSWSLVTVDPGQQQIKVPFIDSAKEGTLIDARVYQLDDKSFAVSIRMEYSEIRRPIPVEVDILIGKDGAISNNISLPVLDTTTAEGDLRMTSGSGMQLFTPSNGDGKDTVLVLWFEKRTDGVFKRIPFAEGMFDKEDDR